MTVTFVDAGVLIAATRAQGKIGTRALDVLDDTERSFVSTAFVMLEVLPKSTYFKRVLEIEFYERYFRRVSIWVQPDEMLLKRALDIASESGMNALDALHVAAAESVKADELVTTERVGKAIHRTNRVKVITIHVG